MATELLYLVDAYLTEFDAKVIDVRENAVALDRTIFYPTGGGQPNDTGDISGARVTDVRKEGAIVWHTLESGKNFVLGDAVKGRVDWDRRHKLMRTHTAMHVLC